MKEFINLEQLRIIVISAMSPILAHFSPTRGFLVALILMYGFNVIAGMRADGITINNCHNFSLKKFRNSLGELLLYLVLVLVVYSVLMLTGDEDAAFIAIKSLTYVFLYVYLQNGFKNLIQAYPRNMSLRLVYHVIRFELTKALPSTIQEAINKYESENENVSIKFSDENKK